MLDPFSWYVIFNGRINSSGHESSLIITSALKLDFEWQKSTYFSEGVVMIYGPQYSKFVNHVLRGLVGALYSSSDDHCAIATRSGPGFYFTFVRFGSIHAAHTGNYGFKPTIGCYVLEWEKDFCIANLSQYIQHSCCTTWYLWLEFAYKNTCFWTLLLSGTGRSPPRSCSTTPIFQKLGQIATVDDFVHQDAHASTLSRFVIILTCHCGVHQPLIIFFIIFIFIFIVFSMFAWGAVEYMLTDPCSDKDEAMMLDKDDAQGKTPLWIFGNWKPYFLFFLSFSWLRWVQLGFCCSYHSHSFVAFTVTFQVYPAPFSRPITPLLQVYRGGVILHQPWKIRGLCRYHLY